MIQTKEDLIKAFRLNSTLENGAVNVRWSLYSGHKATIRNQSFLYKQDDESLSIEDSIEKLSDVLDLYNNTGKYTLYVPVKAANRGAVLHAVLGGTIGAVSGGGSVASIESGFIGDYIKSQIELAKIQMENDSLIYQLENPEDDDLKKVLINGVKQIIPHIPSIISSFLSRNLQSNQLQNIESANNENMAGDEGVTGEPEQKAFEMINELRKKGSSDKEISDMIEMIKSQVNAFN